MSRSGRRCMYQLPTKIWRIVSKNCEFLEVYKWLRSNRNPVGQTIWAWSTIWSSVDPMPKVAWTCTEFNCVMKANVLLDVKDLSIVKSFAVVGIVLSSTCEWRLRKKWKTLVRSWNASTRIFQPGSRFPSMLKPSQSFFLLCVNCRVAASSQHIFIVVHLHSLQKDTFHETDSRPNSNRYPLFFHFSM